MNEQQDLDRMAGRFLRFAAQEACDSSPLYERLSRAIADDPEILALAAHARPGQPVPNLLFAAVQYLLLKGTTSPLADYYTGLAGFVHAYGGSPPSGRPDGGPYPPFRSFCREHEGAIARLLETRRVQTNEVGRAACLLPAFGLVARRAGGQPLALVEIGASAGLLLLWDRYGYDYGDGPVYGDAASPVRVRCAARGSPRAPIPAPFPSIAYRVGLDLDPVDARDGDQALWLRALVWPEHAHRAALLTHALEVARRDPPPLYAGDALDLLPRLLPAVPSDAAVCLYHCYTLNQWPREARARLSELLAEHSHRRDLYRISLEHHGGAYPELRLAAYQRGVESEEELARCHAHGAWIEWLVATRCNPAWPVDMLDARCRTARGAGRAR